MVGKGPDSTRAVLSDLVTLKKAFKSFMFTERLTNISVVDPATSVGGLTAEDYADSVHLKPSTCRKLARALTALATATEMEEGEAKRTKLSVTVGGGASTRRGRGMPRGPHGGRGGQRGRGPRGGGGGRARSSW